jgi:hypothetical protein
MQIASVARPSIDFGDVAVAIETAAISITVYNCVYQNMGKNQGARAGRVVRDHACSCGRMRAITA